MSEYVSVAGVHGHALLQRISRGDIERGESLVTVDIPYDEFVACFGPRHSDHPSDWDAPGPVELWFFRLPWGHRITLEYHLTIDQVNIYLECLEIDAVIDVLGFRQRAVYLWQVKIHNVKASCPAYTQDLSPSDLYRLDDNGNTVLMHRYESRRVADYYQALFESRGHKQLYWVETPAGSRAGP